MAFKLRHPFRREDYTARPDGLVEVDDGTARGLFSREGLWVSGTLRIADAQMCRWVGTHEKAGESRHAVGFRAPREAG